MNAAVNATTVVPPMMLATTSFPYTPSKVAETKATKAIPKAKSWPTRRSDLSPFSAAVLLADSSSFILTMLSDCDRAICKMVSTILGLVFWYSAKAEGGGNGPLRLTSAC